VTARCSSPSRLFASRLVLAQGYVTAQDRLWQMDLSRRLAVGELSQVFGERTLRLDLETEHWDSGKFPSVPG